jgi:hypothetical protein
MSDQEIDRLFREGLQERPFEPTAGELADAQTLLEERHRRRSQGRSKLGSMVSLIIAGGYLLYRILGLATSEHSTGVAHTTTPGALRTTTAAEQAAAHDPAQGGSTGEERVGPSATAETATAQVRPDDARDEDHTVTDPATTQHTGDGQPRSTGTSTRTAQEIPKSEPGRASAHVTRADGRDRPQQPTSNDVREKRPAQPGSQKTLARAGDLDTSLADGNTQNGTNDGRPDSAGISLSEAMGRMRTPENGIGDRAPTDTSMAPSASGSSGASKETSGTAGDPGRSGSGTTANSTDAPEPSAPPAQSLSTHSIPPSTNVQDSTNILSAQQPTAAPKTPVGEFHLFGGVIRTRSNGGFDRPTAQGSAGPSTLPAFGLEYALKFGKVSAAAGLQYGTYGETAQLTTPGTSTVQTNIEYIITDTTIVIDTVLYEPGDTIGKIITVDTVFTRGTARKSDVRVSHFEVPILFGYEHSFARWSIGAQVGVFVGFLSARTGTYPIAAEPNAVAVVDETFRSISIGYLLRPTVKYRLNEQWSIGLEPFLKGHLTDIVGEGPLNGLRYGGFGGSIGLFWRPGSRKTPAPPTP